MCLRSIQSLQSPCQRLVFQIGAGDIGHSSKVEEVHMTLRTWHGRTALGDAEAYETFMKERAAPDYGSVDGLENLFFTRRDEGDVAHFLLVTLWRDIEAVKAFAGADPAKAKYYPEDDKYLLEKEDCSLNHRVFFDG
jgi:heme-degrading monooxygenase HmoA